MPSKVKKRWIERQIARGHHKFVEAVEPVDVVKHVEPVVEDVVEDVDVVEALRKYSTFEEDAEESTVVEGGTVTDVEVVEEVVKTKKKVTKKTKKVE